MPDTLLAPGNAAPMRAGVRHTLAHSYCDMTLAHVSAKQLALIVQV
jgi:hypothetical protein